MAVEWGTVPDWVAAVGTVGAFVAAVVIYGASVRQSRLADRRSQARLFDAWVSSARWADFPEHATGAVTQKLLVTIDLSNASGQSVRGVDAELIYGNTWTSPPYLLYVIPPTALSSFAQRDVWLDVEQTDENKRLSNTHLRGLLKMNVSFTDATGNRWRRTWSGDLTHIANVARQSD